MPFSKSLKRYCFARVLDIWACAPWETVKKPLPKVVYAAEDGSLRCFFPLSKQDHDCSSVSISLPTALPTSRQV